MKTWKWASLLVAFAAIAACNNENATENNKDADLETSLKQPINLTGADSAQMDTEMGTDREGIEEKDLDKKSADFDPAEVKLGKEHE